jgi:hypothetical protein
VLPTMIGVETFVLFFIHMAPQERSLTHPYIRQDELDGLPGPFFIESGGEEMITALSAHHTLGGPQNAVE